MNTLSCGNTLFVPSSFILYTAGDVVSLTISPGFAFDAETDCNGWIVMSCFFDVLPLVMIKAIVCADDVVFFTHPQRVFFSLGRTIFLLHSSPNMSLSQNA
ncbi:MAG TPA: hypothetical protein DCY49_03800 [Candidatus Jacksonbacteria bacterium]|nr:hypothetical protein [Candidatus Jacksonbacteria bacterium]